MGYISGTGIVPTAVGRTIGGQAGFNVSLAPGQTSASLVVATNASQFGGGGFLLTGFGTSVNNVTDVTTLTGPLLQPVPEPFALLLAGTDSWNHDREEASAARIRFLQPRCRPVVGIWGARGSVIFANTMGRSGTTSVNCAASTFIDAC